MVASCKTNPNSQKGTEGNEITIGYLAKYLIVNTHGNDQIKCISARIHNKLQLIMTRFNVYQYVYIINSIE